MLTKLALTSARIYIHTHTFAGWILREMLLACSENSCHHGHMSKDTRPSPTTESWAEAWEHCFCFHWPFQSSGVVPGSLVLRLPPQLLSPNEATWGVYSYPWTLWSGSLSCITIISMVTSLMPTINILMSYCAHVSSTEWWGCSGSFEVPTEGLPMSLDILQVVKSVWVCDAMYKTRLHTWSLWKSE